MKDARTRLGQRTLTAILAMSVVGWGGVAHAKPASSTTPKTRATKTSGPKSNTSKVKISAQRATQVARKRYPGVLAGKTVLENEDGKWQYAVMIRSGKVLREVQVDANTGKVLGAEVTTAAKEAAEAKAEAKAKANPKSGKPAAQPKEEDEKDEKGEANEKHEGPEKE